MKGKELFENHNFDEGRFVEHIKHVKNEIKSLTESIPKKEKQLIEYRELLKKLENMTLEDWLNEHKL
jgi:hypothetical protein